MKVGKEEVIGLIVALERYLKLDYDAVMRGWETKARYIADRLQGIPGVVAEVAVNTAGFVDVDLSWDRECHSADSAGGQGTAEAGRPAAHLRRDDGSHAVPGRRRRAARGRAAADVLHDRGAAQPMGPDLCGFRHDAVVGASDLLTE